MREALEGLRKAVGGWRREWNSDNVPNHPGDVAERAKNLMGGALKGSIVFTRHPDEAVPCRVSVGELKPVRG